MKGEPASWCQRESKDASPLRARSPISSISLSAGCGPAWVIAELERLTSCVRIRGSYKSQPPVCGRATPMTLPLRRKHRTTAPNSTREKAATSLWGRLLACQPRGSGFKVQRSGLSAIANALRGVPALAVGLTLTLCALSFAQSEPQALPQNVDARPIEESPGESSVLRWQSKP